MSIDKLEIEIQSNSADALEALDGLVKLLASS